MASKEEEPQPAAAAAPAPADEAPAPADEAPAPPPGEQPTQPTQPAELVKPASHAAEAAKPAASAAVIQDVPDPEEDDLDDLDDMLDEFSAAPGASGPGRPDAAKDSSKDKAPEPAAVDDTSDAFTAELQKEMAALMGEIDESPAMQEQLDAMMRELGAGVAGADSAEARKAADEAVKAAAGHAGGSGQSDRAFQDTIKRTMERMAASGEQASAKAAEDASGGEADMLEALLREMATAGGEGGADSEEDFSKMLLGMMEQLTNKEILYEPMKDLHTKFPAWMKENEGKVDKADWDRYIEQQSLVGEIVERFEKPGYTDESADDREFIVERMQKMQAAGSPPADLVGDMKDTQDALGDLDSGCAQQ